MADVQVITHNSFQTRLILNSKKSVAYSPIVVFAYDRLEHLRLTIEALANNKEAAESDLIVYSDAAASVENVEDVDSVRGYLKTICGFRNVLIHQRSVNIGLAQSIISGVNEVLVSYNTVIVLEDDLVTSPYFLSYMNGALKKYEHEDRVASIHAYLPPISCSLPETFFMPGSDCWGWGVWRRSWSLFNADGQQLLDQLKEQNLLKVFDLNGSVGYSQMLYDQINGKNNSWAIRWHASTFIANKLTLHPGRSLIQNTGLDGSGTHCQVTRSYDTLLTETPIYLADIVVEPSTLGLTAFAKFFKENKKENGNRGLQLLSSTKLKRVRKLIEQWLPPVLLNYAKKAFLPTPLSNTIFTGNYHDWNDALNAVGDGYASHDILDTVLQTALLVKQGRLAFERDSVGFTKEDYSWPLLSVLMAAAAIKKGQLNVLDFGGSLGSRYFQHKFFLDLIGSITWSVIEQPHFVAKGKKHLQSSNLLFYETVEECTTRVMPNVVLLSGVLSYLQDPISIIQKMLALNSSFVILDRTCFYNEFDRDMIAIQHVPPSIYEAKFPCRFLNEHKILKLFELAGYKLIDRIRTNEQLDPRATWACCLFSKTQN